MDRILYYEIAVICVLVLMIILYNDLRRSRGPVLIGQLLFRAMMIFTIAFAVILAVYKGIGYEYGSFVVSAMLSLYYIMRTLIFCCFLLYIDYEMYPDNKRFFKRFPVYVFPAFVSVIMVGLNCWTGWIFKASENGYDRGPLFYLPRIVFIVYTVCMFGDFYRYEKARDKNSRSTSYRRLLVFPFVPCISTVLQIFLPTSGWILSITMIAILINYIAIQNSDMARDHLTGLYNRSQLEVFMNYQIKNLIEGNYLFLIMLDLDKFKQINDTYGHVVGDDALIHAGNLLRNNCKKKSDYVVRLGGDEFVLIGQCESKDAVKEIIDRIHEASKEFNRTSGKPYRINFSAGYVIYDGTGEMTLDKLISKADQEMYKNKRLKKQKKNDRLMA